MLPKITIKLSAIKALQAKENNKFCATLFTEFNQYWCKQLLENEDD